MAESQRAFYLKGIAANSLVNAGARFMHCFFMRAGHIAHLSASLTDLSDQDAVTKAQLLFSERRAGFDGFEVWDRARMVIRHPDPSAEKPAAN